MPPLSNSFRRLRARINNSTTVQEAIILLFLALLALVPRLYRINNIPAGLAGDELFNAIDALRLGPGSWQIYFEGNNGREALHLYLIALSLRVFGQTVWAVRLPAVLLGTGSVLLAFGIGRSEFNRRVGFVAGVLMAVSFWPVIQSRWGFRAVSLTLMTALTIYLYGQALRKGGKKTLLWLAAGIAFGLTMYSYIPARLFPFVILFWFIWLALTQHELIRQKLWDILLSLGIALIVFAPFGLYMIRNPEKVNQRIRGFRSVFDKVLDGQLEALFDPVSNTIRMFFISGDAAPRYFMVDQPVFDPLVGILLVAGLISTIWFALVKPQGQDKRAAYGLLLLWLGAMLVPGALAGFDSFTLRASGAIVPLYLMVAIGLETIYSLLMRKWPARRVLWQRGFAIVVMVGLAITLVRTWHTYFKVWIDGTNVRNVYHLALAEIGRYLEENPPPEGTEIFIAYDYVAETTPQAFPYYSDLPATWFNYNDSFGWRPDESTIWYFEPINRPLNPQSIGQLAPISEIETIHYGNGDPAFRLYRANTSQVNWIPQHPLDVRFEDGPRLIGFDFPGTLLRGEEIPMTLHWQVPDELQPLPNRLTYAQVFLQDESGNVWAQGEKLLGYPEAGWRNGDRFTTFLKLEVPEGIPPGPVYLRFGLRDWTGPTYNLISSNPERAGPFVIRSQPMMDLTVPDDTPLFDDTLALQGHSFSSFLVPGLPIDIALDWLVLNQPESDYRVQMTLSQPDADQPFLTQTFELWPDIYPPSQWLKGEQVTTFHRLDVPLDIPTDTNPQLNLQLLPPDTDEPFLLSQGTNTLAELELVLREHIFEPPVFAYPLEARFGDDIRLLGYDLDTSNSVPNGQLRLTLYWQAINTPADSYTVFNHLVGNDGQIQGQLDSPPVSDAWLTSTWLPGEIIVDERDIPIRPNATAGTYSLIAGLYTASNGKRVPIIANGQNQPGDQLLLSTVTVNPE